jgi:hypothetical protein
MMVDRPTLHAAGILDPRGQAAYACFVKKATKVAPAVYSSVFAFRYARPKSAGGQRPPRGTVLCAGVLADGEDAVPPSDPFREGHSPLCPQFSRTARTRSLPGNHRGRGTVLRARLFGGARLPGGAQSPVPAILADRTNAVRSKQPSREGHGPLRPPVFADGEDTVLRGLSGRAASAVSANLRPGRMPAGKGGHLPGRPITSPSDSHASPEPVAPPHRRESRLSRGGEKSVQTSKAPHRKAIPGNPRDPSPGAQTCMKDHFHGHSARFLSPTTQLRAAIRPRLHIRSLPDALRVFTGATIGSSPRLSEPGLVVRRKRVRQWSRPHQWPFRRRIKRNLPGQRGCAERAGRSSVRDAPRAQAAGGSRDKSGVE